MTTPGQPSRDSYPAVDALVTGMQTRLGTTERWDMVVSYSLDSLNSLLAQLWAKHPTTGGDIVLVSENQNEEGDTYHIRWSLQLGAPLLKFTYDDRAELTMTLSGTFKTVEKGADGKERPTRTIPNNQYALVANVPLHFVHAVGNDPSSVKPADPKGGSAVSFVDDPNAALHVVFSFDNTTEKGASYTVLSMTPNPPPSSFTVGLAASLSSWMSNPANVQAINYSLASVQNKPIPDVMYLVPQEVAFSVYAKAGQEKVGCLSLYITTQDSDNQPGDEDRQFKVQIAQDQFVETYPIPDGYTASIIIRHDLFATKFLRNSLLLSKSDDNTNTFREVTIRQDNQVGFGLDMRINSRGMGKFSTKDYWGGLDVDAVNWDFGREILGLTVDNRTNASWAYGFHDRLGWERDNRWWGKTYYDLTLNKTSPMVADYSDVGLAGRVELTHDDWKVWVHEWNPDPWERINGGTSDIPDIVRNGLQSFHLPAFKQDLRMDYFAATNLFGPGQHIISVAGDNAIWMPYDVLILGHLQVPLPGLPINTSMKPITAHVDSAEDDTTSPAGSTSDFVLGLSAGQPILKKTLDALKTGDEGTIDNFLANSGYNITDDGLETALKTAQPGPAFDVRNVGGAYSFKEPTDLKLRGMSIDPTTGRIYIGGIYVGNSTDDRGHVVWDMDGFRYDVQFTVSYNDDDTPKPNTFAGSRAASGSGGNDAGTSVSGQQDTDSQPSGFAYEPPGVTAAWAIGIFGASFSFIVYIVDKYRKKQRKTLEKQAEKIRNGLSKADASLRDKAATAAADGFSTMDLADFRGQIEDKVRSSVKTSMDENKSPDEVAKDAAGAAKDKFKNFATEYLRPTVTGELAQFKNSLGKFIVDRAVGNAIGQAVDARSGRFNMDGSYMTAITGAEIARYTVEAKQTAAQPLSDALTRAKIAATEEFNKAQQKEKAQADYAEKMRAEGMAESDLVNDPQYKSLGEEISQAKEAFNAASEAEQNAQRDSDKAQDEINEAAEEEKRARDHANEVAEETFKGKP